MTLAEFHGLSPAVRAVFCELALAAQLACESPEPAVKDFGITLLVRAGWLLQCGPPREIPSQQDLAGYIGLACWATKLCDQALDAVETVQ